jgi:hypothetical protein
MNDMAQVLEGTLNLCLVYLVGTIGLILLMIGIFRLVVWIADR